MFNSQAPQRTTPRPRWQFSLLTLLIAMSWVGLASVALVSPSELWGGLIFVLAVGLLLVAGLCIVYRSGQSRAFAVGFVIFAATYFFVSMGDSPDVPDAHTQLPTTRWGIALYSLLHGDNVQVSASVGPLLPTPVPVSSLTPPPRGMTLTRVVMTAAPTSGTGTDPGLSAVAAGLAPVPAPTLVPVTTYIARTTTQPTVPLAAFLQAVHHLLVTILGVIGGTVAQVLYSTRRDPLADH
jgi:Gamma-aminobutyrate permease and related permeases